MSKPKRIDWDGNDIPWTYGGYVVSYKLDGVCCIIDRARGRCVSRNGKPLMHTTNIFNEYKDTSVERGEIYLAAWPNHYRGSFKDTVSRLKTIEGDDIRREEFYPHTPAIHRSGWGMVDQRLFVDHILKPLVDKPFPKEKILAMLAYAIHEGYEGLVLQDNMGNIIKVKPKPTFDVVVVAITEGKGRNAGRLGALITEKGNVGIGFSDQEREEFMKNPPNMIEVACMELTEAGKFRHPRFIRVRDDK